MNRDILLNGSHDISIMSYDVVLTDEATEVSQRVKQALLLILGEWFLDRDIGVPYLGTVFGEKNSFDAIKAMFVQVISSVFGVKEVLGLDVELDNETRVLSVNFRILDIYGNTSSYNIYV